MRYFVTFKPTTSAHNKLMVFTNIQRNDIQDILQQKYHDLWHKIYTEQEASTIVPQLYCQENLWIPFGSEVKLLEDLHKVSLQSITDWFKTAKPNPVPKNLATQLGANFEEFGELVQVFASNSSDIELQNHMNSLLIQLNTVKQYLYKKDKLPELNQEERIAMLDALADQVVTLTGVAYFANFKFDEALTEVNKSNFSKFRDNKPVLNQDGKIIKGKDYFKPELSKFI